MFYDLVESGKRIAVLRKEKGVTQEQMADDLGLSTDTIGRIERGAKGTSVDMMSCFAEYFGTSMDYIVNGKMEGAIEAMFAGLSEEQQIKVMNIMKTVIENI